MDETTKFTPQVSSVATFVWENSHSLMVSTSVVWISHMKPELGTIVINT